jgi:GMP synthase (glutamine-hydrolysing)
MNARLLVIQHEDNAPAAWLGEWLLESGIELSVVLAHRGEAIPSDLSGYDGLLVLGGAMGANDDDEFAWLAPTKELIAETIRDAGKPFLGICLGHQLGAVAAGGTVTRNPNGRALGLTAVRLTEAGRADPRLGGLLGPDARAVQWNDDIVVQMPADATVLALAPDDTVQAARFGPLAWGVQFHPEVSPEVFALWGAEARQSDPSNAGTGAAAQAARAISAAAAELETTWRPLAERLASLVSRAAATRGVQAAR